MNFINDLIDMNSSKNSKILIGLIFSILTILIIVIKLLWLKETPMELLYFVGGMAASFFGLGIITPNNSNPNPE